MRWSIWCHSKQPEIARLTENFSQTTIPEAIRLCRDKIIEIEKENKKE